MRRELAEQIMRKRGKRDVTAAVDKWLGDRSVQVERFTNMIEDMKLHSDIDFATLSVAAREFRKLIST